MASYATQAQVLPEPLLQAARKAVLTNPDVQARWNGFKAANNEQDALRGGFLPQIDLASSMGRESRVTPIADYGESTVFARQISP